MHKPCIIITRPAIDAAHTAGLLHTYGLDYFIEPVLTIETILSPEQIRHTINSTHNNDGIIITSRNAARAITDAVDKSYKIISLGKAANNLLTQQGFSNCEYAGDNIQQLCNHLKTNYSGSNFVYLSGESITQELNPENCGIEISRIIVYRTTAIAEFSSDFVNKLKHGDFDAVMFLSKKTAKVFCTLIEKEGLIPYIKDVYAFCFSSNIESLIGHYGFKATIPAKSSDIEENIQLISKFQFA